jgi:hypothetical protein
LTNHGGAMTPGQPGVEINMSGIPVNGIGGLGLVAGAVLMTVVLPAAWWLLVVGAAGGVILGAVMVVARRSQVSSGPSGDDPTILFRPEPVTGAEPGQTRVRPGSDSATRVPFSLPSGALTILSTPVRDRS